MLLALSIAGWQARLPWYARQIQQIRDQLWTTFPNVKGGSGYSGSYWNEADYEDPSFQESHWVGEKWLTFL
jgi:hypothetical protein